jgi:outer membrane immunogenic protein
MKKLVFAASILVLGTAAASAADLAPSYYKAPPPAMAAYYNWSGFYGGINGGWGTSRNCWTRTATVGVPLVPALSEGCHDASGGTIGGQLGYRWQAGPWVFGLEAQGNWADFTGRNVSLLFGGLATNRTKIDAFGLFTGQVGYSWNNVLGYVKGGAAVTDNKYEGLATIGGFVTDRATDTRWGGVIGAGIEYGFAPNWSAALEYDHMFMGTNNYAFASVFPVGGFNTRNLNIRQDVDLVTVRVNYRFGGPVVARY